MAKIYIDQGVRQLLGDLWGWYLPSAVEASYKFTYIAISTTDPTRLSGMALNLDLHRVPTPQERADRGTFLKPGKFLRSLKPEYTNDQISLLAAELTQKLMGEGSSLYNQLQTSDTPSEIYTMRHASGGVLGESCMRNMNSEVFELYDIHQDIKILYLTEEGDLIGRALLHEHVEAGHLGYIKFMDRVYVNNDNHMELFFRWARSNGYYRKEYQSANTPLDVIDPGGKSRTLYMYIECPEDSFYQVPYMDTFPYYCSCKGILHNDEGGCIEDTLFDTDGGSENGHLSESGGQDYDYTCRHCDCGLYDGNGDYSWVGDECVCDSCISEYYSFCDQCDEYVDRDDIVAIKIDDDDVDTWMCSYCAENFDECEYGKHHVETTIDEYQSGVYTNGVSICEDCAGDEEFEWCTDCGIYYPEGRECPSCRRDELLNSTRVAAALYKRLESAGMAIKNMPGYCFLEGDNMWRMRVVGSGIRVDIVGTPNLNRIYTGIRIQELVNKILIITAKSKGWVEPIVVRLSASPIMGATTTFTISSGTDTLWYTTSSST